MAAAGGDDPAAAFAAAMDAAGPFETRPSLAVAISGGADSTCLMLLADAWAHRRGGRIVALTVDHGLRAGSAREAAAVGGFCARNGVAHVVLPWTGAKPASAIQARAREARYGLLEAWCAEAGILHLLVGHHADDQDETVAMRAARRSGVLGLAGMAAVVERSQVRVLRPLLGVRGAALRTWLAARDVAWIEDPSNRDPRFLRARLRSAGAALPRMVRHPDRRASELALAEWFGTHAAIHPEGWVEFDVAAFARLGADMSALVLRAAAMAVSGAIHPPPQRALARAAVWLAAGGTGSRCFSGCLLLRDAARAAILRDAGASRTQTIATGRREAQWDRRFRVRLATPAASALSVAAAAGAAPAAGRSAARSAARYAERTLPVVHGLDEGPHRAQVVCGRGSVALVSVPPVEAIFRPPRPLAGCAFAGSPAPRMTATHAPFPCPPVLETPFAGESAPQ
jgi:tRNA(Ile)-lysidine synthase